MLEGRAGYLAGRERRAERLPARPIPEPDRPIVAHRDQDCFFFFKQKTAYEILVADEGRPERAATRQVPQAHRPIIAAGGQQRAIRAERDGSHRGGVADQRGAELPLPRHAPPAAPPPPPPVTHYPPPSTKRPPLP